VIVYFTVFTIGVFYILKLMGAPPHRGEQGPAASTPARAAGITPLATVAGGENR
jgi:cytochrome d ubiquinol oxidase subunit I